ncbi:MAG: hypothetical protein EOO92_04225 [Pedobacter sp.]|nr:MAG: hypothetical protein EOO92_04225 [Pedobacter sp.]
MKKQFLLLIALLSVGIAASAQKEYKVAKSSGRLILNIDGAIVEGYNGNEIIFSKPEGEKEVVDERAKGLRIINGSGFTDNTGLGLDVTQKGDEINVNPVSKNSIFSYSNKSVLTIKVPQNVKVSFINSTNNGNSEIVLKNLKNEIEVSTTYNKIKLENNTGPMNVKSLHGSIDAIFSGEMKGPVSIISVYGHVDVALPANTKANVELSTNYGKLYAADGLKIAVEKTPVEKKEANTSAISSVSVVPPTPPTPPTAPTALTSSTSSRTRSLTINGRAATAGNVIYTKSGDDDADIVITGITGRGSGSSDTIKGKLNGGGADLILKSNFKNVYLREKQ